MSLRVVPDIHHVAFTFRQLSIMSWDLAGDSVGREGQPRELSGTDRWHRGCQDCAITTGKIAFFGVAGSLDCRKKPADVKQCRSVKNTPPLQPNV